MCDFSLHRYYYVDPVSRCPAVTLCELVNTTYDSSEDSAIHTHWYQLNFTRLQDSSSSMPLIPSLESPRVSEVAGEGQILLLKPIAWNEKTMEVLTLNRVMILHSEYNR